LENSSLVLNSVSVHIKSKEILAKFSNKYLVLRIIFANLLILFKMIGSPKQLMSQVFEKKRGRDIKQKQAINISRIIFQYAG